MARRILVTPRSMTERGLDAVPELQRLTAAGFELVSGPPGRLPTLADLRERPRDIIGWLAGVEPITADVLDLYADLVVISRNGAGADAVDLAAAGRRGVSVVTARGANARGVAELALAQIMNGLRSIPAADRALHAGGWVRSIGRELPDVTVGIVGYGAIGRLLGSFLVALGAGAVTFDPYAPADDHDPVRRVGLDELFTVADVVSLHSPPPADGRPLVGAPELARMRPGGLLVNTARSSLVDPAAVLAALRTGQLAGYAVDAFDAEPPVLTPLLLDERTILTPHLGGYTAASTRRATEQSVTNLLEVLAAGPVDRSGPAAS